MNPLRSCLTGPTDLDHASAADLDPGQTIVSCVTHGDPDYAYEFSAALNLLWNNHPNIRVIVQGIGDNEDSTSYGQWQTRQDVDALWQPASPMRYTRGRLWFPSDYSTRAWLSQQLAADKPQTGRATLSACYSIRCRRLGASDRARIWLPSVMVL